MEKTFSYCFTLFSVNPVKLDEPVTFKRVVFDLLNALNPLETHFYNSKWFSKAFQVLKFPVIILLRLTVPQANIWCKTLSMIHCFTMPLTVLVSFDGM